MTKYILTINPQGFILIKENNEITITSDYEKATTYSFIGDAMRAAIQINRIFEEEVIRVKSILKSPVSE